jgi:hypothetical protein
MDLLTIAVAHWIVWKCTMDGMEGVIGGYDRIYSNMIYMYFRS